MTSEAVSIRKSHDDNNITGRMIETSLTLDMVYIAQKYKLDLRWYDRSKSNFKKTPVLD